MKKLWLLMPLLSSCGLFQKSPRQPAVAEVFASVSYPELHKSLVLDYTVKTGSEEVNYSIYPLSDSGYDYDYDFQGGRGTSRSTMEARQNSVSYSPRFHEGTDILSNWLGMKAFNDLKQNGSSLMDFGAEGVVTFRFAGMAEFLVVMEDTSIVLKVVELTGVEKPWYIAFVPDPKYPLIVKQKLTDEMTLVGLQNKITDYSSFEPGKGCVLQYRMVEAGVNDYQITLHNMHWDDSILRFDMSGTYSGSYDYDFQYDVVFKGKALFTPDFMVPVFSAVKGEKVEDNNWIFLRKSEISEMEAKHKAYLQVPHFALDPRDYPEDYTDTAEFNAAMKDFNESYRTEFIQDRAGRMNYTDYMYYDSDWIENRILPALRMLAPQHDMELMVLNRGRFPLLLFYDDGQMYEIMLESAGAGKGEE